MCYCKDSNPQFNFQFAQSWVLMNLQKSQPNSLLQATWNKTDSTLTELWFNVIALTFGKRRQIYLPWSRGKRRSLTREESIIADLVACSWTRIAPSCNAEWTAEATTEEHFQGWENCNSSQTEMSPCLGKHIHKTDWLAEAWLITLRLARSSFFSLDWSLSVKRVCYSGTQQNSSRLSLPEDNFEQNRQFSRFELAVGRIRQFTSRI